MANAGNHFAAGNQNLIADELSIDGLSAAVTKMRKQVDAESNDLDIVPRVLAVTPELENVAKGILQSIEVSRAASSDNTPTGNPLKSVATLEVESRLSNTAKFAGASEDHWYLFGGPTSAPVYVGFLDGQQSPKVEYFGLDSSPNVLAHAWRVYLDFGAALGEHRSGVYSTGEGGSGDD